MSINLTAEVLSKAIADALILANKANALSSTKSEGLVQTTDTKGRAIVISQTEVHCRELITKLRFRDQLHDPTLYRDHVKKVKAAFDTVIEMLNDKSYYERLFPSLVKELFFDTGIRYRVEAMIKDCDSDISDLLKKVANVLGFKDANVDIDLHNKIMQYVPQSGKSLRHELITLHSLILESKIRKKVAPQPVVIAYKVREWMPHSWFPSIPDKIKFPDVEMSVDELSEAIAEMIELIPFD